MSKYSVFETNINDQKTLCAALTELGFKHESHAEPQTLLDWHGNPRPEKAHVIIRRADTGLGASNDVGFLRQPDGVFRAIISEYDEACQFNKSWLGKLSQAYTTIRHIAVQKAKGYIFGGKETIKTADGKEHVKLRFYAR